MPRKHWTKVLCSATCTSYAQGPGGPGGLPTSTNCTCSRQSLAACNLPQLPATPTKKEQLETFQSAPSPETPLPNNPLPRSDKSFHGSSGGPNGPNSVPQFCCTCSHRPATVTRACPQPLSLCCCCCCCSSQFSFAPPLPTLFTCPRPAKSGLFLADARETTRCCVIARPVNKSRLSNLALVLYRLEWLPALVPRVAGCVHRIYSSTRLHPISSFQRRVLYIKSLEAAKGVTSPFFYSGSDLVR